MKKKSCSLVDAMGLIKGSNIKYKTQYEQYWEANANTCMALRLPKYPMLAYKSDFPGWDAFLGNPEGTAVNTVREIHTTQANNTKFWKTGGRKVNAPKPAPKPVIAPVQVPSSQITQDLSMANIIETLHNDYGIALTTLYRLNEEAKQTSLMKVEAINETLTVLVKIAMEKTHTKVKV